MASFRDKDPEAFDMRNVLPLPDLSSLTNEDYLDHVDELIATEAKRVPDIKDQVFLDSDIDE